MGDLPQRCIPCRGGIPALAPETAEALRREHTPEWILEEAKIRREFRLRDFAQALRWILRVGALAEEEAHHPDVHLTRWNHVELVLWTHKIGGLHENDFVLAKKIDALWKSFDQNTGSSGRP